MCGRYLLDDEAYADILMILNNLNASKKIYGEETLARGEIFPTNIAPVFEKDGISAVKWGFPHWKNEGVIINARSETAAEKSMFKTPLRKRRCVVPSGGFYEWSRSGATTPPSGLNYHTGTSFQTKPRRPGKKLKDKYLFRHPGEHMIFMAGILNTFKDASGEEYSAFAILTTAANDSVAPIHDRMPVILGKDELDLWINDDSFVNFAINRITRELSPVMV